MESLEEYMKKSGPPKDFTPGFMYYKGLLTYFFKGEESYAKWHTPELSTFHSFKDDSLCGIEIAVDNKDWTIKKDLT